MKVLYLDQELVPPVIKILKSFLRVDVVYEHAAVCSTIEGHSQALKTFLSCCIPDLRTKVLSKIESVKHSYTVPE